MAVVRVACKAPDFAERDVVGSCDPLISPRHGDEFSGVSQLVGVIVSGLSRKTLVENVGGRLLKVGTCWKSDREKRNTLSRGGR